MSFRELRLMLVSFGVVTLLMGCGGNVSVSCTVSTAPKTKVVGPLVTSTDKTVAVAAVFTGTASSIDASQWSMPISLTNASLISTSGQMTLTVKSSGSTLGTHVFAYYLNGDEVFATNPTSVNSWLQGFVSTGDEVDVSISDLSIGGGAPATTSTITTDVNYQSVLEGRSTFSFVNAGTGGGCPPLAVNCQPK